MKKITKWGIILVGILLTISCSLSVENDNTIDSVDANETFLEYSEYYSKIHEMLRENEINPSIELASKIAELENEAYHKFSEYMIKADTIESSEITEELSRDTTNRYTWANSVRAVGSFGFATIYWTEPYVASDFVSYGINRRSSGSSYYYRIKTSYDPNFDYYRDYNVYSNSYYYYYVKLDRDYGYYLSTNEIRTYIN